MNLRKWKVLFSLCFWSKHGAQEWLTVRIFLQAARSFILQTEHTEWTWCFTQLGTFLKKKVTHLLTHTILTWKQGNNWHSANKPTRLYWAELEHSPETNTLIRLDKEKDPKTHKDLEREKTTQRSSTGFKSWSNQVEPIKEITWGRNRTQQVRSIKSSGMEPKSTRDTK